MIVNIVDIVGYVGPTYNLFLSVFEKDLGFFLPFTEVKDTWSTLWKSASPKCKALSLILTDPKKDMIQREIMFGFKGDVIWSLWF